MAAGEDAAIAQLMAMGFQPEAIEEYQVAMASSTEVFSMQAATEWLVIQHCLIYSCLRAHVVSSPYTFPIRMHEKFELSI